MKYVATVNGRDLEIDLDHPGEIDVDGVRHAVDLRLVDGVGLYSLILDNASFEVFVERTQGLYTVLLNGDRYVVDVEDARLKYLKTMGGQQHEEHSQVQVNAPMPGMVVKVLVAAGDTVVRDQGLLILEAMKMENEIRSPRPGVVRSVHVEPGRTVVSGDVLATIGDEA